MKSILHQLYEGELTPIEDYQPLLQEHQKLLERQSLRCSRIQKELEKLNPDLLATFTELMENYERETYFDTAQMYVDGFCLGMKIMAEAYNMELSTKEE